jgi:trimethylamine--corrinoid protein Co-methyltransferase
MVQPDSHSPKLQVLTEAQCQALVGAALECLDRIGVNVLNPKGRHLLQEAGALIENQRVRIPPDLIRAAIECTPSSFELWHRDGKTVLEITPEALYFGPGPTCTYFQDPDNGERRKARRGDAGLTARVCDALNNIDFVMSLSLYADVTAVLSPVYEFADMITNTTKPIAAWANDLPSLQAIHQIASCVAGGEAALQEKPFFIFFSTYQSPLQHPDENIDTVLWAAEHGIPVAFLGGPTVGLESPVTSASGLVLYLASALSGLAMIQLAKPGAAVAIGGLPSPMDLRTARPSYGSPEMCLNTAAACELARSLNLPFMGTAGATESKLLDAQAGVEISAQVMMAALSSAGLVHDVGFLDCADIGSLGLLVLADEVIDYTRRILRGIEVSPETIMLELIEKVGPGGQFLAEPASVRLSRQEIWMPKVLDRSTYQQWSKAGSQSTADRINDRLRTILVEHQPPSLPAGIRTAINAILAAEEKRIGIAG